MLETSVIAFIENLWGHMFDPNKRLFWGYILATLVFASFVWWRSSRHTTLLKFLFPKKVWLHRSAKTDYLVWLLNALVKTLVIIPLLFSAAPIAIKIMFTLESWFGEISPIMLNQTYVAITFTLMLFVLDDLTRFLLHWLLHKVPALWAFHKVHHSAEVMTPMTVYRIHPMESILYAMRLVLSQGVTLGIAFYLFGHRLDVIDVLGANIGVFLFNSFAANLRHSHVWLTWPAWLENWIISPAQHQIHHSCAEQHRDKNLGSALAIWDRMMGCLVLSKDTTKRLKFGVGKQPYQNLFQLYYLPVVNSGQILLAMFKQKKAPK